MLAMPDANPQAGAQALAVRAELADLLYGFARTQALYVCVRLGLPDLVGDEPVEVGELAARVSAHPPSLYRLLRFLASLGIFAEVAPGRFAGTRLSAGLREDAPLSLRYLVLMNGSEMYRAWGGALYSVRTGESAFEHVYGMPHFEYLAGNPEAAGIFNRAMAGDAAARVAPLLARDWRATRAVADIGGGDGSLLARLLTANGQLHGVVFDLPHAADGARSVIGQQAWPTVASSPRAISSPTGCPAPIPTFWPRCCTTGTTRAPPRSCATVGAHSRTRAACSCWRRSSRPAPSQARSRSSTCRCSWSQADGSEPRPTGARSSTTVASN